ncbi:hypothetical protein TNIN_128801 [Trichonephila inaurata madagascariensis]|uniref:Uncharacterized protein n=1 Tax=Trichonephila inaurata madagascariensis TaxID=2747483 RepID=A0A8X6YE29_9ARAC|nr:hypothetical protein TNIN_128801 [Trichonephila inaurata madagascariensis]
MEAKNILCFAQNHEFTRRYAAPHYLSSCRSTTDIVIDKDKNFGFVDGRSVVHYASKEGVSNLLQDESEIFFSINGDLPPIDFMKLVIRNCGLDFALVQ